MKAYKNPELEILNLVAEDILSSSVNQPIQIPDIDEFGGDNDSPPMSLLP